MCSTSSIGPITTSRVGGNPTGGYAYVSKERKPGRYQWSVSFSDAEPNYTWITDNAIAWSWERGGECMGLLPNDFNEHDWSDIEDTITRDSDAMESQGN